MVGTDFDQVMSGESGGSVPRSRTALGGSGLEGWLVSGRSIFDM